MLGSVTAVEYFYYLIKKEVLYAGTAGIVGDGSEMLSKHKRKLTKLHIRYTPAGKPDALFNIAVVTKNDSPIPFGIHAGYMDYNELFQ